jgi:hypothetical protein
VPELKQRPYEHHRPRRPANLSRRTQPPPERSNPPDMTLFVYAGIALAAVVVVLAIPYVIQYLIAVFFS